MQSSNVNAKNNYSACGISAFGLIKPWGVRGEKKKKAAEEQRAEGFQNLSVPTRTRHPENKLPFVRGWGRCSIRITAGEGRGKKSGRHKSTLRNGSG